MIHPGAKIADSNSCGHGVKATSCLAVAVDPSRISVMPAGSCHFALTTQQLVWSLLAESFRLTQILRLKLSCVFTSLCQAYAGISLEMNSVR